MAGTLTVQNIEGPTSGANANKIIIPSGQTLDASAGTLTPSAGQIVQVVETHVGDQATTSSLANENASYATSTTSTSWVTASFLNTSITPTSASSKLLLNLCVFANNDATDGSGAPSIRIVRGSTLVWTPQENATGPYGFFYASGAHQYGQPTIQVFDEPSTTSQVTYSLQYRTYSGGASNIFGYPGSSQWSPINTFTIMEIAQ